MNPNLNPNPNRNPNPNLNPNPYSRTLQKHSWKFWRTRNSGKNFPLVFLEITVCIHYISPNMKY